ncbi:MAG: T9SS type A sorting domain-containing protein [Bacteroidales bacterium]|nr:T9SS type A sorting domain-containing protein [Bacteroidales bacterium]
MQAPVVESNLTSAGRFDGTIWQVNESGVSHNHALNQITLTNASAITGYWMLGEDTGCFDDLPTGKFTVRNGNWDSGSTCNGGVIPAVDGSEDITIFHAISTSNTTTTGHVNSLTVEAGASLNLRRMALTVDNDVNISGTLRDSDSNSPAFNISGNLNILSGASFNLEHSETSVTGNMVVDGDVSDSQVSGLLNVNSNLQVNAGATFDCQRGNNTITGTTTVDGIITDNDGNGNTTFTDLITISATGSFTSNNYDFDFLNGLENNGTFTNSSSYVLDHDVTISGTGELQFTNDLYIADNVTLTNQNTGGITITDQLDGQGANAMLVNSGLINYNDNDRVPMNTGILDCSSNPNTFNYNRTGRQYIKPISYYNLILADNVNDGNYNDDKILQGATQVLNDLSTSGFVDFVCNNHDLTLSGAVNHASSGAFSTGTNTVTYNGTGNQDLASISYSGNLVIEGSGTKSLQADVAVSGTVTVQGTATFSLNGNTLTTSDNIVTNTGAALEVNDNAVLQLGDASTLTNNGILRVVGSAGNPATITTSATGGYLINQSDAAAAFHALYAAFDATGGITISDGAVDATNNFSHTSFTNGTGQEYLQLSGLEPVGGLTSVQSAVFDAGPTYNISRTAGTTTIEFSLATGALAGENFDNDNGNPGTLIEWTDPGNVFYSTGNVSAGLTSSWARNQDGSGGNPADLSNGTAMLIVQDGHTVTLDSNGDINVRKLTVGEGGANAYFIIGADATVQTLTIQELLDVNVLGEISVGSNASHHLHLYGNLINDGVVDLQASFTSVANTHLYGNMEISGSVSPVFNDIVFEAGATVLTNLPIDVNRHIYLEAGAVFNDGGNAHTVEFNWINNGGTYTASGNLEFDGGTSVITATGTATTFNNLSFTGGGLSSVSESIDVTGDFIVSNDTRVSVADKTININGNFTISAGSEYIQNANTTNFIGTNAQALDFSGTTAFYNVGFSNGGASAKSINGNLNTGGNLTINDGATVDGAGSHVVGRYLRVDGTCNFTGSLTMNNGSTGYIETSNASPATVNLGTCQLIIDGRIYTRHTVGGSKANFVVNNDVDVQSGYLVLNNNTALTGQVGNSLTFAAGTSLYIRGVDNFPGGFGTFNFDPTAWVRYDASFDQNVRGGFTYGQLMLDNPGTKTVDGAVEVTGILEVRDGAVFDLGNFSHTFSGSNLRSEGGTRGIIEGSNSTLIIIADANQTIEETGTNGYYNFGNLILSLNGASQTRTKTIQNGTDLRITGNLSILNTGGTDAIQHIVNLGTNNITGPANNMSVGAYCELQTANASFGTNVINSFAGTKVADVNSTVYYSLNGAQQIASGLIYGNIELNGGDKTAEGDLTVLGNFRRVGGTPVFYDAGGTHTIHGNWNMANAAYYTSVSATGTIVLDGADQDIDGVNFNNLIISNTGSANIFRDITVFNNLTVDNGSTLNLAAENLSIGGNLLVQPSGVFTQSTGRTTFNGTGAQTITSNAASSLGYLSINKTASPAQTVTVLSELHISRNTDIHANAGVLDISGQSVYFGDNLYVYENTSALNFITAGSTAFFNGSAAQNIRNYHAGDLSFHHIEFSGADKTFEYSNPAPDRPASRNCIVNGNFTINGAVVNGYTIDFYVQGDWINSGTFQHGNNRTVYFNNTTDQSISSSSFGNVIFTGDQNKTLTGAIAVSNNLTIDGTANLNAAGYNITVGHEWHNENSGTYTHGNGKVIFNSSSEADLYTGNTGGLPAGKEFYAVDFNKSSRANLQGDLVVSTDLTVNSSELRTHAFDVYVGGNFVNAGTYNVNNSASTLTLNGTSGNTYTFDPNGATLRELVINASGATYDLASDFAITSVDMNLMAGALNLNEHTLQLQNSGRAININGGTLNVNAGSTIQFTENQSLNLNSGVLQLIGEAGKPVTLENTHTNVNRLFTVNATGGTLHALHYHMQKGVINIAGTAVVDAVNNLSNGTFTNGYTTTPYLTLDIDFADFAVTDLIFNSGAQNNVYRPAGHSGVLNIQDASGGMAGEVFENDPDSQVDWTFPSGFFWDGGGNGVSWNDAINWDGNTIPGSNNIVYLNHDKLATAYNISISGADAVCKRLNMDTQGGNPISVTVGSGRTLDVEEHISIAANTTLSQADNTALIVLGHNWTNLGTYNHGNSSVTFDAAGGNYIIATGGTGAGKDFYNLTFNAPSSTYVLDAPMTVVNNMTITDGTLDLSSPNNDLNIGGNWLLDQASGGVFIPSTADVTFDGVAQSITNGTFYNVNIAGTGIKTINSNIAIDNTIVINSGTTLDAQENNLYVRGNWTNNGGTFSQTGLGSVNFDRTGGNQQIDNGSASTVFNNIAFYNSASKTLYNDVDVNGNVLINAGSGLVNIRTFTLNGIGASNELTNNSILQIEGASNFPGSFETLNITSAGEVRYYSDGPQDIYPTSYYNLRMRSLSDGVSSAKTALGDLVINGSLYIDGNLRESVLDMSANDANITLTGGLSVTANSGITWGTGNATMEHVGSNWNIDADITGFNHLILSGSDDKALGGDLHLTGDLTVRSNVDLELYSSNNRSLFRLLTGEAGSTFTMEIGARTLDARPDAAFDAVRGGVAIAEGFGTYTFNEGSTYFLYSQDAVPQTLKTGINYGNLSFRGTKDVTSDGVADLIVKGEWDINVSTYYDGGRDTYVAGAYAYVTRYIPSSNARRIILDGLRDQRISDDVDNLLETAGILFSGTGTKTIGDGNDVISIDGDLIIDAGVTATTGRNITFNGANWTNNGVYTQTGGSLTFAGVSDQTINPGSSDVNNYFRSVYFNNASTKNFVTNGADINGVLTINAGTVNLGSLSHTISGTITNTTGGVLVSSAANIDLDGAGQNVNTPAFEVGNLTTSGSGSKYLYSDWTIHGDLLINAGTTLNTRSNSTDYDIYIKGNWTNNGSFTDNSSKVTFDGSSAFITVTSGGSNFYDVEFAPSAAVQYQLLSPSSRFANVMTIGADAELDLNGQALYIGRNNASQRTHTVNGTLTIDEDAYLYVNNYPQSIINIESGGQLNIIGSSASSVATLSSETTDNRDKTMINVRSGGTLAARYYLIEYIADAGINMEMGSTLHSSNNFSDGTWLGMRNVQDARYLILEADYAGGPISNVSFNYNAGVPLVGKHYNVQRINATVGSPITFDNVSGAIGSYRFEEDDQAASDTNGKLRWPAITETYWTGAVDVDWHVAGNWDNGIPSATIDAIIPDVSATTGNNPFILNSAAECKSLIITDGRLRMENDHDLTTFADVSISDGLLYVNSTGSEINVGGDWLIGTHGNFTHGGGTVNFVSANGSVSIVPGDSEFNNIVFNNAVTIFDIAAASMTVDGNVLIQNGTVSPSSNNYRFDFKGNYQVTGGTYNTAVNGTIALCANGDQVISDGIFDNLEVSGSGNKQFNGTVNVNGNTNILSTLSAQAGSNIDFKGDMDIDAAGTFNDGGESHTFNGTNWYGDGAYVGNGTVTFNRTNGDQNLYSGSFNNLVIDCSGRILNLLGNVNVTGDVTFKTGINRVDLKTNTITSDGSGNLIIEPGVNTYVYGADNFPKSFAAYNIDASSTTYYYGSADQTIAGVSYGHLRLNNANIKTLGGDTEVKGHLYFNSSTLDAGTNHYQLSVGYHWYNNSGTPGHFICRNGEVVFNGSVNQNIYIGGSSSNDFYNLTASSSGNVQVANNLSNDFVVENNLNVTNGTFDAEGRTIYVGGDLMASAGGRFTNNTGTYYLNKASGTANIGVNGSSLGNLTINSGATYTVQDEVNMTGSFNLISGTFDGNGNVINIGNGSTDVINIDGTYIVGAGGVLGIGNGSSLTVSNTGSIEVVGSTSAIATVSNNTSGGRYNFTVEGQIAAEYYIFEYMSNTGIYLMPSSTIDATNHFSNGTFSNGTNSGQLFRVENTQSFTEGGGNRIENVSFPNNPGGSASNVAKYTAGSGVLEFYNSTGIFAGENFDNDPSNLINWTGPVQLTWNGSVSTDWNTANNWTASSGGPIVPTSANNVTIANATNQPVLTVAGQQTGNLTIDSGSEIRISTPADAGAIDLDVNGDLQIDGTLRTISTDDYITVEGNWTRGSTGVVLLNGNVTFDGVGGAKIINNRGTSFHSLTIAGSSQYYLGSTLTVNNDVRINAGSTFDLSSSNYTLTVNGNWVNNGTFNAQQRKVVFSSASGPVTIHAGGSSFYNVDVNAPGVTYNLTSDLDVTEIFNLQAGTLDVNTNTLAIGNGSGSDEFNIYGMVKINEGATLDMANNASLIVNSGGEIELLGTDAANMATLTSSSAGRYSFDVTSGASIKARFYQVDYTDADGLYMHPGANIDATNNLSDGIFSNGASGGSYLTLLHEMGAIETLSNLVFNAGPSYCVTRTSGTTVFEFEDASGDLGNYLFEKDDEASPSPSSGLLRWPFVNLYSWEGDVSNDWFDARNWTSDVMPDAGSTVTIPADGTVIINNSSAVEVHGIDITAGGTVTLQPGGQLTTNGDVNTNDGFIIQNTNDSPASYINHGNVNGNITIEWTYGASHWWFMGHSIDNPQMQTYRDMLPGVGQSYALYDYQEPGTFANLAKIGGYEFPANDHIRGYQLKVKKQQKLVHSGTLNTQASYEKVVQTGWQIIANPYASYYALQKDPGQTGDFASTDGTVYVSDSDTNDDRQFLTFNVFSGLPVPGDFDGVIAPTQSFYIRTAADAVVGTDKIVMSASNRIHDTNKATLKSGIVREQNVLRLKLSNESGLTDEAVIALYPEGTTGMTRLDSEQRMYSGTSYSYVYSLVENTKAVINVLPEMLLDFKQPIGVQTKAGEQTLQISGIDGLIADYRIVLEDKSNGTLTTMNDGVEYNFTSDEGVDHDRFVLHFKVKGIDVPTDIEGVEEEKAIEVYVENHTTLMISCEWDVSHKTLELYNVSGALVMNNEFEGDFFKEKLNIQPGVYIVKVSGGDQLYQQKVFVK